MAAAVPYPSFQAQLPVDATAQRAALVAVGRCRIHPDHATNEHYRSIVAKAMDQAQVDINDEDTVAGDDNNNEKDKISDAKKKLRKKYTKEGVALAKHFLIEELQLDVSIVDVEVVVQAHDLVATDGCLASCLLDAGCQTVVVLDDGDDDNDAEEGGGGATRQLQALEIVSQTAGIPPERLGAHFRYRAKGLFEAIDKAKPYCSIVSVLLENAKDVSEDCMLSILESVVDLQLEVVLQLPQSYCASVSHTKLAELVGRVCKTTSKQSKGTTGTVSLIDPCARQLGLSFASCLYTDRTDGLFPTVVVTRNNEALGLVYSSAESIVAALECGRGVYYSRSRNGLWRKGDTSGHTQTLHRLDADCDGDALRFTVTQQCGNNKDGDDSDNVAAFCHLNTLTCWGLPRGVRMLEETLQDRLTSAPQGSYTKRLFDDEQLLQHKLVEEAQELSEATTKQHVAEELADVLYFAMVKATKAGVSLDDAVCELDKRARKVTRRPGDSKAFRIAAGKAILQEHGETEAVKTP